MTILKSVQHDHIIQLKEVYETAKVFVHFTYTRFDPFPRCRLFPCMYACNALSGTDCSKLCLLEHHFVLCGWLMGMTHVHTNKCSTVFAFQNRVLHQNSLLSCRGQQETVSHTHTQRELPAKVSKFYLLQLIYEIGIQARCCLTSENVPCYGAV